MGAALLVPPKHPSFTTNIPASSHASPAPAARHGVPVSGGWGTQGQVPDCAEHGPAKAPCSGQLLTLDPGSASDHLHDPGPLPASVS